MRVQLLSDLHFEFYQDRGQEFIQNLHPEDVDVLVLAGDIGVVADGSLMRGLSFLSEKYGDRPIVAVLGNHAFYGSSKEKVQAHLKEIQRALPTVHYLENSTVTIEGQRFVGCTLWFHRGLERYERHITDFRAILGFRTWCYDACVESLAFLAETVQDGDFVITHHVPTAEGIHPKWQGSPINGFFMTQVPRHILTRPAQWVFGHTHDSVAFDLEGTHFRCNPRGYPHEINPRFSDKLVLGGTDPLTCVHCFQDFEVSSDHLVVYGRVECPSCGCDALMKP